MSSPDEKNAERNAEKSAEKKARRKFRHEIFKRMRRIAVKRFGLYGTKGQLDAMAKVWTDRYMHSLEHAPTRVAPHLSHYIPPRASEQNAEKETATA
jgi:hypothetical protein